MPVPAVAAASLVSATPVRGIGFDGLVYASAYVGSPVYVGGSFRNAIVDGRLVSRKRLAAMDARTGDLLPWAPATNGTVMALTASGSSLYVSGRFTTVAGQPRAGLGSINLTTGAVGPLQHTVQGVGSALAVGAGRLYLGGTFDAVDGRLLVILAWLRLVLPHQALAVLYDVDRSTMSNAVRQIRPLPADAPFVLAYRPDDSRP